MRQYWTGERLETFITNETMTEHLHRYAIALEMASGKIVLDIACGEGYGANLLATRANKVMAVDIDNAVIAYAKEKYRSPRIQFIPGSVLQIPAADQSFDLITCFETLEHTDEHEKMMFELKRVLKPGGLLLISTPEKLNYTDKAGYSNPHHKKELYGNEFKKLVNMFFKHFTFYRQFSGIQSLLLNDDPGEPITFQTGDYYHISAVTGIPFQYWLAIASDAPVKAPPSGLFCSPKSVQQIQYEESTALKRTITYRLGNILLFPLKYIHSLFRK